MSGPGETIPVARSIERALNTDDSLADLEREAAALADRIAEKKAARK